MLSPAPDDEDDSHLCIKCNATIMGLDNYVKHRREACGKKKYSSLADIKRNAAKTDMSALDALEPTYNLGADVFFQSLELQSSVKKTSIARLTLPAASSKTSSNVERKFSSIAVPSTSRDVPRMSPVETHNLRGEDWIGGHSLRIVGNEDNQTRLINAVNNISGVGKKDTLSTSYNSLTFNEFKDDESDDASEDTDDEEEDDAHASGGKWKPPLNHTGGKWRPASPDHDEWELGEEHTGGKWKPIMATETQERDEDYDAPPPSHTKGKWVPGAHEQKTQIMQNTIQSKGSVQYWCGACNRRLGSRTIYEKHLQSNLHLKKILPENDLEFSGNLGHSVDLIKEKRTSRPSRYVDETVYSQIHRKRKSKTGAENISNKKKRKRKPYYVHCPGCKSKVRLHFMGKHLISHYHIRKAIYERSDAYQQLILDNIEAIVHQSPFQCSPCRFYTNWLSNLMQHWFTEEHEQRMMSIEGRYWCSFCKFECEGSEDMLQHMSSLGHTDFVAAANRSVPIIIRKKTILKCGTCLTEFRYNIELKKHCKKTGHDLPHTATDLYQELHNCHICDVKFKSSLTLAAHLKTKHKQKSFFCLVCSLTFNTSDEAKRHRFTSEHRIRQKEKLRQRGVPTKDLRKKCPYCVDPVILNNILVLKEHIRINHPDKKKKCSKCGMAFILPQEVTRHVRNNACQFRDVAHADVPSNTKLWKCSQCLFQTDSKAECLFHDVLHSKPEAVPKVGDPRTTVLKYTCPLCQRSFSKASLRLHIRQHTFERPYVCALCSASFTRQSALSTHIRAEHGIEVSLSTKIAKKSENASENEDPKELNAAHPSTVTTESIVKLQSSHPPLDGGSPSKQGKHACSHLDCNFVANTVSQLSRHARCHGSGSSARERRPHACPLCEYRSSQASHMRRHALCHQGARPYVCPHCDFTCASLENLRKHALRGRHAGLPLYRCAHCPYSTDRASELRTHLASPPDPTCHPRYTPREAAHAAKTHLMRDPPTLPTDPLI